MISLVSLCLSAFGFGAVLLVYLNYIKGPKLDVSEIKAQFQDPIVTGGTCLKNISTVVNGKGLRRVKNVIPAIYGSVIVENKDQFSSDNLRSCSCIIEAKKGDSTIVKGIGAWDEEGMQSLEKEKDVQKGDRKQLHVFRAIIEPDKLEGYGPVQEQRAASFPVLRINQDESPMFETEKGKIWIELPEIVEAQHGGWRAKQEKPKLPGEYEIIFRFEGEDFECNETKKINFKEWLKENSENWQSNWQNNCPSTLEKAQSVIESL